MPIFGQWQEADVCGENPHVHGNGTQTPLRKTPGGNRTRNLIVVRWLCWPPHHCAAHYLSCLSVMGCRKAGNAPSWLQGRSRPYLYVFSSMRKPTRENFTQKCTSGQIWIQDLPAVLTTASPCRHIGHHISMKWKLSGISGLLLKVDQYT